MKIKLSYKLFSAFLMTSLAIVLLIVLMQYYAFLNFADYVNKTILEKLDGLVNSLAKEYQISNGWDGLRNDPKKWHRILSREGFDFFPPIHRPPPRYGDKPPRRPPPKYRGKPEPPPRNPDNPPLLPDGNTPPNLRAAIGKQLTVFDAQKQRVIGSPFSGEQVFREIKVGGNIVGWLGLKKREHLSGPLETAFLKQQYTLFYGVGGVILILTLFVSFLLSRHILKPIRQLTEGTQALTSRQFKTKIDVQSSDELGQLASDFNLMAQTLQKYEEMRQQWIADISHELRTPLSILRGEIEAMQDGIREMSRENLDSLHSEIIHLAKLVDDLHTLSLADSQNLFFRKDPIKPLHILKEAIRIFQIRLDQREIEVQLDPGADDDIRITGDGDRLMQVYSNILENTLRYTDAPGILKIQGNLSRTIFTLCFEDSGPGVPESSVDRIFDRLYRTDRARSRAMGGSGLGLAICKEIVENHGGKIRAENVGSGGLQIEIEFPIIPGKQKH
jgi:two-component system sensor histidine kinase BaeS